MSISNVSSPSLLKRCILISVSVALWPMAAFAQLSPSQLVEEQALAQIRFQLEQEYSAAALQLIEPFLEQTPPPARLDHFIFWHAVALNTQGDANHAIIVLEQFLEEYPVSPLTGKAQLMLGTLYTESHQPDRAVTVLSRALNLAPDDATRKAFRRRLRLAYELQGDYRRAVQTALTQMAESGEAERRDLMDAINNLILQTMDERSLTGLLEAFSTTYPGDVVLIRLIELHTTHGDEVLAERDIRAFLHRFPNHPYAQTAAALLRSFIAKIKAHRHVVAAVMPLSGDMKPFGTEAFNGIRLAWEQEAFLGSNAIGLVVKDSARPAAQFRHEVSRLLDEFNPIALIGPLLAREVQRLADVPGRAAVPFITPTATLPNVKQLGRYWFSTAMTPSLQIKRLVEYAMRHFGYTRFCVLTPQTIHGRQLNHMFQQAVIMNGGEVIAVESYQPGTTDASAQMTRIKTKDLSRYGALVPMEAEEPVHPASRPVQEEAQLVYVPGFDALFLPGRPPDVAFLSAQLAFLDMPTTLLGTNGWNHPNLLTWGHSTLEGGFFGDALFFQSADPNVRHFVTNYRERFQTDPSIFAAQAYEAMRAILDTIRQGATTGPEVREQLLARRDLPTLGGLSRFDEGGILDRKVYMIQIHNGRFIQLN